jgi:membrane associated rhomboid family serine protease
MSNFSPTGFRFLPPVIKNILIINVLFFLYLNSGLDSNNDFSFMDLFALHYWKSDLFKPWQLVTHMFMHVDFTHLLFNMFAVWMFGYTLENYWGSKRFIVYYLLTGIGAGAIHLLAIHFELNNLIESAGLNVQEVFIKGYENVANLSSYVDNPMIGASGAFFGILMAFGMLFPNREVYLYFLFPVKVKYFVIGLGVIELINAFSRSNSNIAYFAHLGGMLVGFIIMKYWKSKRNLY